MKIIILLQIVLISITMQAIKSILDVKKIKVISLDVTGTLLIHKYPIMNTYADCAVWSRLDNPPSAEELKPAFKKAYYKYCTEMKCFGYHQKLSPRGWWSLVVKDALKNCGRNYNDDDYERYFRRIYQHYGSLEGYEILPDALDFLKWASSLKNDDGSSRFNFGVTTNTPTRTIETVLPMIGYHNYFSWFVCSGDIGEEKPSPVIYNKAFSLAQFWTPNLKRNEIIHIGDSLSADFCGSRAAGFQSLNLDRSSNPRVTVYQDWLEAPHYTGKSKDDIMKYSVKNFDQVRKILEEGM